jgi:predicted ATPase
MHDPVILAGDKEREDRLAEAVAAIEVLLATLDQLGLAVAAAHVSMAGDMVRAELLRPSASEPSS